MQESCGLQRVVGPLLVHQANCHLAELLVEAFDQPLPGGCITGADPVEQRGDIFVQVGGHRLRRGGQKKVRVAGRIFA